MFPEVDPKSITFTFDFDIKSVIEKSVWMAGIAAIKTGDFYLMNFEIKDGEPNYRILSKAPEFYWKLPFQCPQDADLAYQKETGELRPVPSALATPDNKQIIAKPDLCDSCEHRLSRAMTGMCPGKYFKPL